MITEQVFHPEGVPVATWTNWGMENKPNVYGDVITESFNLNEATSTQLLDHVMRLDRLSLLIFHCNGALLPAFSVLRPSSNPSHLQ